MDENRLKTIVEEVVNRAVEPIKSDLAGVKEDLKGVRNEVAGVKEDLKGVRNEVAGVKEDLVEMKETQEEHTRRLEALAGDTEQLLDDVKGIRDEIGLWHQRDKREIDEIKKHLDLPIMSDIPQV